MATETIYPVPGFHFKVTFEGIEADSDIDSRFHEVSGFSAELTTEELLEGGVNDYSHKLPVRTKFPNLVLKRAVYPVSSKLIAWVQNAIYNFEFKPCNVMVTLLNENHKPLKIWNFFSAYPVKFQTSDLKAQDNAILVETLELTYKFFKQVNK